MGVNYRKKRGKKKWVSNSSCSMLKWARELNNAGNAFKLKIRLTNDYNNNNNNNINNNNNNNKIIIILKNILNFCKIKKLSQ